MHLYLHIHIYVAIYIAIILLESTHGVDTYIYLYTGVQSTKYIQYVYSTFLWYIASMKYDSLYVVLRLGIHTPPYSTITSKSTVHYKDIEDRNRTELATPY